jgi:molybdate transport system substrate-binding protein
MDLVVRSGDAATPVVFARNRLVLVRRVGADVGGLADLADPDLLIGLCSTTVPCGRLAQAELAARGIEPSLDTEEPDVRSLLAKVASGELDAALVFATDVAAAGPSVDLVETDLTESTPYLAAVVGGSSPSGSREFVEFLSSARARDILEAAGFEVP